jgi:hypothetical protein
MQKKLLNTTLVIIPIVAVLLIMVLFYSSAPITGNAVKDDKATKSQKYLFYNNLRVPLNPEYSNSCYPLGEVMESLEGNKCCDGLTSIPIVDEAQTDCQLVVGISLCSNCGNSLCEYGENDCNCPEDCNSPD